MCTRTFLLPIQLLNTRVPLDSWPLKFEDIFVKTPFYVKRKEAIKHCIYFSAFCLQNITTFCSYIYKQAFKMIPVKLAPGA